MDQKKVNDQLKNKFPGKQIFYSPKEIICEVEPTADHAGYSVAVAIIDQSQPHYHTQCTETYKIIKGELTLVIDNQKHLLTEGESFVIKPNQVHYAIGNETWVECFSEPGWNKDDHILVL